MSRKAEKLSVTLFMQRKSPCLSVRPYFYFQKAFSLFGRRIISFFDAWQIVATMQWEIFQKGRFVRNFANDKFIYRNDFFYRMRWFKLRHFSFPNALYYFFLFYSTIFPFSRPRFKLYLPPPEVQLISIKSSERWEKFVIGFLDPN